jgi:hypothetical protein
LSPETKNSPEPLVAGLKEFGDWSLEGVWNLEPEGVWRLELGRSLELGARRSLEIGAWKEFGTWSQKEFGDWSLELGAALGSHGGIPWMAL